MPLPENGADWPPKQLAPVFRKMAEHSAWYSGDIDELRAIYGGGVGDATHFREGQSWSGGVAGFFTKMWWGRPLATGEQRTALHIPMAADLATLANDTLNAEPPTYSLLGDIERKASTPTEERLELIMNSSAAQAMFIEAGELQGALGGTYWVVDWDVNGPIDHAFIRSVDADTAVPVFDVLGRLLEVTFWTRVDADKKTYRLVEHHAPGFITHALYESDKSETIGTRVSLAKLAETRHLSELAGAELLPDRTIVPTYIDRLTVVYEPHLRKPRQHRKAQAGRQGGRSLFEGIEPLLNSLDETWSSWMRDLKLGRGRIFVPEAMLQTNGRGKGASFDAEREVYAALSALPSNKGKNIEATQFAIRVDEHERTAYNLTKKILQSAGYSLSSYGEHGDGVATATEVLDRRTDTERTRDKRIRYASRARTEIASIALEVDGIVFRGKGGMPGQAITVEWPDVSQIDPEKDARIIGLLDAATAISIRTKVERANPDWDDDRIDIEVDRILHEKGILVPDPATFIG